MRVLHVVDTRSSDCFSDYYEVVGAPEEILAEARKLHLIDRGQTKFWIPVEDAETVTLHLPVDGYDCVDLTPEGEEEAVKSLREILKIRRDLRNFRSKILSMATPIAVDLNDL